MPQLNRKSQPLTIRVQETEDQKLAHSGGLDLHVKTTKYMISDNATLDFPEKEGDSLVHEKGVMLSYKLDCEELYLN